MKRALILMAVSTMWIGCGGGGGGGDGGGGGGGGNDIGVTLSTAGGATSVTSGGALTVKANVTNSTTMVVTWSLTGPSCPSNCGTITPTSILDFAVYAAPANVTSQFTVTVTATSTENTTRSGSVTITVLPKVCPPGTSLLSGQYAFLLQGFDQGNRDGIAVIGSATSDGCGIITGGTADYYLGPNVAGNASLSGSYTVGSDKRGMLRLIIGATTVNFAIALGKIDGGVAFKGAITEMDPAVGVGPVLSGSMWRQDSAAFALNRITGPFAFVFNGWNGSGPREAMGGTLTADGAGVFTGGPMDDKILGSAPPVTTASWSGGYATPSSSGRSVVTAPALTGTHGSAVMYVVAPGQMIFMISDTSSSGRVFSGNMVAQTGPFSLASLSGNCVTLQTANYHQPAYPEMNATVLAVVSGDGTGGLTITSYDQNFGGNFVTGSNLQDTYTVDANGQVKLYDSTLTLGGKWYLTGPNTGLMLGFDYGVSVGTITPQSAGPFSAASISGSYFASQAPGAAFNSMNGSGVATSTGGGTLVTTMDLNSNGVVAAGQAANGTLTVSSSGRAVDTSGNVIYVVSPSTFLMMNHATFYPVIQVFDQGP